MNFNQKYEINTINLRLLESALEDLNEAVKLCPDNVDVKKLISKISDEINLKSNNSTLKKKDKSQQNSGKKVNHHHQQQQQQQNQATSSQQQQQQTYIIESAPL